MESYGVYGVIIFVLLGLLVEKFELGVCSVVGIVCFCVFLGLWLLCCGFGLVGFFYVCIKVWRCVVFFGVKFLLGWSEIFVVFRSIVI